MSRKSAGFTESVEDVEIMETFGLNFSVGEVTGKNLIIMEPSDGPLAKIAILENSRNLLIPSFKNSSTHSHFAYISSTQKQTLPNSMIKFK